MFGLSDWNLFDRIEIYHCEDGSYIAKTANRVRLTQTDLDRYFKQDQPGAAIYISVNGNDDNSGSREYPVKTTREACRRCTPNNPYIYSIDE